MKRIWVGGEEAQHDRELKSRRRRARSLSRCTPGTIRQQVEGQEHRDDKLLELNVFQRVGFRAITAERILSEGLPDVGDRFASHVFRSGVTLLALTKQASWTQSLR